MATGVSKKRWRAIRSDSDTVSGSIDLALSYEGKRPSEDILQTLPAVLNEVWPTKYRTISDWQNRLYFGDNIGVMASLREDSNVRGKVRLVYIDPPFATGGVFQSRELHDAYEDILLGAHYVEFLRERLILLHDLLADDGSIYVHLDRNMAFAIKMIMDEVFGQKNFRSLITRKKCNPKNYTSKTYGNVSDFILFYSKSENYVWNRPVEAWDDARAKEYQYIDENGRKYMKVPIHAPGERNGATGQPWRGILPPPGKHWQYTPTKLDELEANGDIYWSPNGNPRRKVYLDESQGVPVQDIWLEFRDAHNQNIKITGFPTEKNQAMIERIVRASSRPGDLVLDCFGGSGTTMAVADELERRWIGIDNSLEAISTILNRFAHGTEAMGDFVCQFRPDNAVQQASFPGLEPTRNVIHDFRLFVDALMPAKAEAQAVFDRWETIFGAS